MPRQTLITIYISMVQSQFYYCSVVWGCCSQSLSQKLQKLQNRAARVITFPNFASSIEELFRELRWVKLDRQRSVDKAIMVYNVVNGAVPQYLCFRFVQRSDRLSYQLRGSYHRLATPLHELTTVKEASLKVGLCCGMACC